MKKLPTVCAILLSAGSVLAEPSTKPKGWFAFTKDTIGCANFNDAIEAWRRSREGKADGATKFVERQNAMSASGDQKRDCQVIHSYDNRDSGWPAWEVLHESPELPPGTFGICITSPALAPTRSADEPCGFWVIVHLRDVIKK
jgi:hypothetical protein